MKKNVEVCDANMVELRRTVGVHKEIDSLGRLLVPKEMRELFNLSGEVEMVVTKLGILIRNPEYKLVEIEKVKESSF